MVVFGRGQMSVVEMPVCLRRLGSALIRGITVAGFYRAMQIQRIYTAQRGLYCGTLLVCASQSGVVSKRLNESSTWRPLRGANLPRILASENYIPWAIARRICVILRLAVSVELRLVTDRQTDGWTHDSIHLASIASRSKTRLLGQRRTLFGIVAK